MDLADPHPVCLNYWISPSRKRKYSMYRNQYKADRFFANHNSKYTRSCYSMRLGGSFQNITRIFPKVVSVAIACCRSMLAHGFFGADKRLLPAGCSFRRKHPVFTVLLHIDRRGIVCTAADRRRHRTVRSGTLYTRKAFANCYKSAFGFCCSDFPVSCGSCSFSPAFCYSCIGHLRSFIRTTRQKK